jgi:uncharacterized protein YcbK (DUF882 family)
MGDLSQHFSRHEFACRCCGKAVVSPELIAPLEALRDRIGTLIHILSGYRCPEHNRTVGGVASSQHLLGRAADITTDLPLQFLHKEALQIASFAHGGMGIYPENNFLHLDVRGRMARWGYVRGQYVSVQNALSFLKASLVSDEVERKDA